MLIAQLTDTHITEPGERIAGHFLPHERLARCVSAINALRPMPDCVVITGDLVNSGSTGEYAALRACLSGLRPPFFLLPGNHDISAPLREVFANHAYLGDGPTLDYVIEDMAVRLVALDTRIPGQSGGQLTDAQLAWLDEVLGAAPQRPTLLLMHHPPVDVGIPALDAIRCANDTALAFVLERHRQVRHILCGHVHRHIQTTLSGIPLTVAPSSSHAITFEPGDEYTPGLVDEPPAFCLYRIDTHGAIAVHRVRADETAIDEAGARQPPVTRRGSCHAL